MSFEAILNGIRTSANGSVARLTSWSLIRPFFLLVTYTLVLVASRILAYYLRFDTGIPSDFVEELRRHWLWIVPLKLLCLFLFGQFSGLLSYFSVPDLRRLLWSCLSSSAALLAFRYSSKGLYMDPRGVILIDFVLSMASLSLLRLTFRVIRERYLIPEGRAHRRMRRVGIFGAGDVGASLARELMVKRRFGLLPVAFFDDDQRKWRSRVPDIPVVGPPEIVTRERHFLL